MLRPVWRSPTTALGCLAFLGSITLTSTAVAQDSLTAFGIAYKRGSYAELVPRLESYRRANALNVTIDYLLASSLCRTPNATAVQLSRGLTLFEWMASEWSTGNSYRILPADLTSMAREHEQCVKRLPEIPLGALGPLGSGISFGTNPGLGNGPGVRFRPAPGALGQGLDQIDFTRLLKNDLELHKAIDEIRRSKLAAPRDVRRVP